MPKSTPIAPKKAQSVASPVPLTTTTPRKRTRKVASKISLKTQKQAKKLRKTLALIALEFLGLSVTSVSLIIVLLGYSANWFSGSHFFSNLLPFALGVLALILVAALLLLGWWKLRKYCQRKSIYAAPVIASCLALVMLWFSMQDSFIQGLAHYRTLVGGKSEASKVTLAHQVYAAYRRLDQAQLQLLVQRAQSYSGDIQDAAKTFKLDEQLLAGIAATESSFLPRTSKDGGQGLFQITAVPSAVTARVSKLLQSPKLDLNNPRHNAYLAAATFKFYLAEMHDDLFLGLLAYNIGPKNGGLRFIMEQYGAHDFVTIQPYLQQLPRDYPIRVLSQALAFRIWQQAGKLLGYEEEHNALRIQRMGVPGLENAL